LGALGPTAVGIGAVATGAAIAAKQILDFAIAASDNVEHLKNLSAQTGLSVQQLDALQEIAKEAGLEGLDLGRTIGMLNEQLAKGNGDFVDSLQAMNIELIDTATGKPKDVVKLLDEMRTKLLALPEGAVRTQAAQEALNGRLRELIPLLLNSKISLEDMIKKLQEMGAVISLEAEGNLLRFDERMDNISAAIKVAKTEITETVAAILDFGENVAKAYPRLDALGMIIAKMVGGESGVRLFDALFHSAAENVANLTAETKKLSNGLIEIKLGKETLEILDKWGAEDTQKAIKRHADELKKVTEQYEKSVTPMAEFEKQIGLLKEAHKDIAPFIEANADKIFKAGYDQEFLTGKLSLANQALRDQAEAITSAKDALEAWTEFRNDPEKYKQLFDLPISPFELSAKAEGAAESAVESFNKAFLKDFLKPLDSDEVFKGVTQGLDKVTEETSVVLQAQMDEYYRRLSMTKRDLLDKNLANTNEKLRFGDGGFGDIMESSLGSSISDFENMQTGLADSFGNFFDTLGDGFARTIASSKDMGQAFENLGKTAIQSLISQLIRLSIQLAIVRALEGIFGAVSAPAAGSYDIWGGAGGPMGFATGGLISGGEQFIKANEQGPEFVMNAAATKEYFPLLQMLNEGNLPSSRTDSIPSFGGIQKPSVNVTIVNYGSSKQFEVEQIDENTVRIIARDELMRKGPEMIANDLANPNSKASKALARHTTARRADR
jgi:hypothetical protein